MRWGRVTAQCAVPTLLIVKERETVFRLDESSITASGIHVNTAGDKDITYRGNSIDIKGFLFFVRNGAAVMWWDFGHKKTGAWPVGG